MKSLKIAIIGAGISGLSAALALSRKGFTDIEVFERAENLGEIGAGIQIGPNAVRALHSLGLQKPLADCSDTVDFGTMRDGKTNQLLTKLPFTAYSQRAYGMPSYQILRSDLHKLLLDQVVERDVAVRTGKELQGADFETGLKSMPTKARLSFSDGSACEADLLIAADGIHSVVARQMHPEYPVQFSGFSCWRALIDRADFEAANADKTSERFGSVSVWVGSGKHLITYPVANSTQLNVVAVTARDSWDFPTTVCDSSVEEWLEAYQGWCPEVLDLIAKTKNPQLWGLFERPALPNWHKENCVLIGDAAHPMLPSLAQGAAQGIEDAVVLAEVLSDALPEPMKDSPVNSSLDDLLEHFYQLRHQRVGRVQESARWNINYFHQEEGLFRSCRNLAMRVAGPIATELIARRYHWLYSAGE